MHDDIETTEDLDRLSDQQFRDGRAHATGSAGHKYPLAVESCTHRSIPFRVS
jgi:hypothetical protein